MFFSAGCRVDCGAPKVALCAIPDLRLDAVMGWLWAELKALCVCATFKVGHLLLLIHLFSIMSRDTK